MTEIKENIYAETKQRYHIKVPLLRKIKDGSDIDAFVSAICLSAQDNYQVKKKALEDTLKSFDGKQPKNDDAAMATWNTLHEDNLGAWTLFYSCRLPEDLDKKWFLSKEQILNDYSSAELGIMYSNYITVVLNQPALKYIDKNDPNSLSTMMDLIIKQPTEQDTAFFLSSFTTASLAELMRSLVAEVTKLRQESGSSGQPSNDTSQT
jgi:hypothetical protein